MKKIFLIMFTVLSLSTIAQTDVTVTQGMRPMSMNMQPAFMVNIPEAKLKETQKNWLHYIGKGSKGKATLVNGENYQPGVANKNISANGLNIYSKMLETTEGIQLTVWINENNLPFISPEEKSNQSLAVEKYMRDFAVQEYRRTVQEELKAEENKLSSLEKDYTRLISGEEKSGKKVSRNTREIERTNDASATTTDDINASDTKITNQKEMVQVTATDPKANKGAERTLSDMEGDKKALQKQNENQARDIDNMNKEIRAEDRNMTTNKENQTLKLAEIENQKAIVQQVQQKLDGIK